jgi:hypothetical protein
MGLPAGKFSGVPDPYVSNLLFDGGEAGSRVGIRVRLRNYWPSAEHCRRKWMKINTYKAVFGAVLAAGLACVPLDATPVGAGTCLTPTDCQFSLAGDTYVTSGSLLFGLDNNIPPTSQTGVVVPPNTGVFSTLTSGQIAGIKNVSDNNPVTSWLTLPDGVTVDLSSVAVPSAPVCTAANNTLGSPACVPAVGSHILLSEGAPDANGNPTVFAQVTVSGTAYTGSSSTGTSMFGGTLSQAIPATNVTGLLTTFGAQGYFNTEYSGRFYVTNAAAAVPEPGTFAALGLGMLVLGSLRKKIRGNKSE